MWYMGVTTRGLVLGRTAERRCIPIFSRRCQHGVGVNGYSRAVLVVAIIALAVAFVSAAVTLRALAQAKRSADGAEHSAAAAQVSAQAAVAADHRARTPQLAVFVEKLGPPDGTEAIYRVRNDGPADLDSVTVYRPVLGPVEGSIRHEVAATGQGDYGDAAKIGSIPVAQYRRFTLSLGSRETLPEFRVIVRCRAGQDDWTLNFLLDTPRVKGHTSTR